MKNVSDIVPLRDSIRAWKKEGLRVGFVPTMGFLHEGHLSLIKEIHSRCDRVVTSIFINPLQFNDRQDFLKYPVDLKRDIELLEGAGVHLLFHPPESLLYPTNHLTRVSVLSLSETLEGKFRPGHFEGVTTVVSKLFHMVEPNLAIFGEKDFQQCKLIEQMVRDLHFDIEIIRAPLIREADGLALSSRNVRLLGDARQQALCLSRALFEMKKMVQDGERESHALRGVATAIVKEQPLAKLEYCEIVSEHDLSPLSQIVERVGSRALIAAFIGDVRLIDTIKLA